MIHWDFHFNEHYEKFRQDQDIHRKLTHIMAAIDDLKAQADATAALVKQLADKIASTPAPIPDDTAQLVAITAELKAATDAAAAALNPVPVAPPAP